LGFGTSYIAEAGEGDVVATIQRAYEGDVNYYELARNGDFIAAGHYRNLEKKKIIYLFFVYIIKILVQ